jgi:N-acetylmuramoyl-L-alanine amidase
MIIVVRKRNIGLILLILLLSITIYSFNIGESDNALVSSAQKLDKVVLLDPGHGGEDPGAVSDYNKDVKESVINLNIAKRVKELLESQGYTVKMTRSEDRLEYESGVKGETMMRKQDLTRRKKMMDELGNGIVVSIHLNKFPQTQYFGAQTFYPPDSPESQRLAGCLQKSIRDLVDPNNKREPQLKKPQVKGNPLTQIIILRDLKTTTAIVECGFLSNQEEEKKLSDKEYQNKLAEAIKNGIVKFYDENKVAQ